MNKLYYFACLLAFSGSIQAQTLSYNWALSASQLTDDSRSQGITVDSQGNTYLLINFTENMSIGALSVNTVYNHNLAVIRIDATGTPQWYATAGSNDENLGTAITTDGTDIYITGWYMNQINFGTTQLNFAGPNPTNTRHQFFLAKLSASGQWQTISQQTGDAYSEGTAVCVDAAGNIYAGGNFFGESLQVGSRTLDAEEQVPFVAKYTSAVQPEWLRGAETFFGAKLSAITAAPNGNIYYTGSFGTVEAESVEIHFGSITLINTGDTEIGLTASDIYVAALSPTGTYLWAVNAGTTLYESFSYGIVADAASVAYIAGTFQEEINNGTQTIAATGPEGDIDVFAAAIDATGNWLWITGAGNALENTPPGLSIAEGDHIIMYGNLDSEPFNLGNLSLTPSVNAAAYISRLNADGSWLWAFTTPSLSSVAATSNNNFKITGLFSGSIQPGTFTLTSAGNTDVYAASAGYIPENPEGITAFEDETACFPQPFSSQFRIPANGVAATHITMMDQTGRNVAIKWSTADDYIVISETEALPVGIYFVKVQSGQKTRVYKTVKAG